MDELIGKEVVVDTESSFVFIGILEEISNDSFIMSEVDVHDRTDIAITKEKYVLDSRLYGIKKNREKVYIMRDKIISVSNLEDVIKF